MEENRNKDQQGGQHTGGQDQSNRTTGNHGDQRQPQSGSQNDPQAARRNEERTEEQKRRDEPQAGRQGQEHGGKPQDRSEK